MRSLTCQKNSALTRLLLVAVLLLVPALAWAKPRPGAKRGFQLFARSIVVISANRVVCAVNASKGQVCVDSTGATSSGGGFWPRGTINQYIFGSGIEVAGIIGDDANPEWRNQVSGGFFEDPKGTTENGTQVQPVFYSDDPDDQENWPDAAFVPSPPDPEADLYDPALHGKLKAADADAWWITWEGDPSQNAGRDHPLGIAVETRGLAFNTPTGNEDVIYFLYTFYNITTANRADYEAQNIRSSMVDILVDLGQEFQAKNNARFGVTIPQGGYTIKDMFVTFAADMDVGDANLNFASVNVPYSLGFAYQADFAQPSGYVFDPIINAPPFFPGIGFIGVKYLRSPINPNTGQQVGLTLYSNTSRETAFQDPNDVFQLYRYSTGNLDQALGDDQCNVGDVHVTRICFINGFQGSGATADMRFFQSSGPLTLPPGGTGTVVVAYVFAAPVATGTCPGPSACAGTNVTPGDPTRLSSVTALQSGANPIDSIAGYNGFTGDLNGNGQVDQNEIRFVPQSLLGKSIIAQTVFDNKFLQPAPPDAPPFFLVPGNNQVTVLWQQSATEQNGDPYFAAASQATLFDPNYRQLDVQGYRIYRGRTDSPSALTLIAQFDYVDKTFTDFTGQVDTVTGDVSDCSPELGIFTSCPPGPIVNGIQEILPITYPITRPFAQVVPGKTVALATGQALVQQADTAISGTAGQGVPFVFIDRDVRNNLRYFYAVAAFDVNSVRSGPPSLESSRLSKAVTPAAAAGNLESSAVVANSAVEGRAGAITDTTPPTIDPATGRFSGKEPPADGAQAGFLGSFAQSIFSGEGSFSAKLIGLGLGDARNGIPITYTYETTSSTGVLDTTTVSLAQPIDTTVPTANSTPFPAAAADASLLARFGVPPGLVQSGQITQGITGYEFGSGFGTGCFFQLVMGDNCTYNGPRWFQGPNETKADPNAGNVAGTGDATDNNNAGELPGILTIQNPQGSTQVDAGYRRIEATLGGAARGADFNVYWGAGGKVDSVIDLTHNVVVPFMADSLGAGWGFLNQSGTTGAGSADTRPDVLTLLDFGCVFPLIDPTRSPDQELGCTAGTIPYLLEDTARPGQVAIYGGATADGATAPARPNLGFAMYLAGQIFMFELAPGATVPASPTVWTMRSYIGEVHGGNGAAGALGPYSFTQRTRSFSALGADLRLSYNATNTLVAANEEDLDAVHTVPDPYYVTNSLETTTENKVIKFVNLPTDCIIRIYTLSGVLVRTLEHHAGGFSGDEQWDIRNRNGQFVSSGVYFYHLESGSARRVGRMTIVNFAQ